MVKYSPTVEQFVRNARRRALVRALPWITYVESTFCEGYRDGNLPACKNTAHWKYTYPKVSKVEHKEVLCWAHMLSVLPEDSRIDPWLKQQDHFTRDDVPENTCVARNRAAAKKKSATDDGW